MTKYSVRCGECPPCRKARVAKRNALPCAKRPFPTEALARQWAWAWSQAVYKCPACLFWHCTRSAQGPDDQAREAAAHAVSARQVVLKAAEHDRNAARKRLDREKPRRRR